MMPAHHGSSAALAFVPAYHDPVAARIARARNARSQRHRDPLVVSDIPSPPLVLQHNIPAAIAARLRIPPWNRGTQDRTIVQIGTRHGPCKAHYRMNEQIPKNRCDRKNQTRPAVGELATRGTAGGTVQRVRADAVNGHVPHLARGSRATLVSSFLPFTEHSRPRTVLIDRINLRHLPTSCNGVSLRCPFDH